MVSCCKIVIMIPKLLELCFVRISDLKRVLSETSDSAFKLFASFDQKKKIDFIKIFTRPNLTLRSSSPNLDRRDQNPRNLNRNEKLILIRIRDLCVEDDE